jgi:hypothetical protein
VDIDLGALGEKYEVMTGSAEIVTREISRRVYTDALFVQSPRMCQTRKIPASLYIRAAFLNVIGRDGCNLKIADTCMKKSFTFASE